MAQQTAMQELIEWAISLKDREQQCIDWIVIKNKAELLLAMEKEQIINFGNDLLAQNDRSYIGFPDLAKEYYNETYNK